MMDCGPKIEFIGGTWNLYLIWRLYLNKIGRFLALKLIGVIDKLVEDDELVWSVIPPGAPGPDLLIQDLEQRTVVRIRKIND